MRRMRLRLEEAFTVEADAAYQVAAGGGMGSADTTNTDPLAALEQAFAAERDAEAADDEDEGGAVDAEPIERSPRAASCQPLQVEVGRPAGSRPHRTLPVHARLTGGTRNAVGGRRCEPK